MPVSESESDSDIIALKSGTIPAGRRVTGMALSAAAWAAHWRQPAAGKCGHSASDSAPPGEASR